MRVRRLFLPVLLAALIVPVIPGLASAVSGVLVQRGLPTAHLNETPSPTMDSNVAWNNGIDYVSGDSFSVGWSGQRFRITQIRTWSVEGPADDSSVQLGDFFRDVTLYVGGPSGAIAPISTGSLARNSNTNTNPGITHTKVKYATGDNYVGSAGQTQIWQNDFTNLNLTIDGGTTYYFAVDGTPRPGFDWHNHATNAALSGQQQDGSNGLWNAWLKTDLSTVNDCDSSSTGGVCNGGWDKVSDINVIVWGDVFLPPRTGVANPPTPCAAGDYSTNRLSDITWDNFHTRLWCSLRSTITDPIGVSVGDTCWYGGRRLEVIQFTKYSNGNALMQCD